MFTKHRGEFYLVMGGMVFAFNGVVSTVVLEHISPYRLAQIRAVGALVFLLAIALIIDRKSLAATPKQMPKLFLYGIVAVLVGHAMESQSEPEKIYQVGLNTSRCLMAVGDIITAWLLLRQADIAVEKLPNAGKDADFYTGKIASAKFFVQNYLPHITADRKIVEATDGAIMEIPVNAF